MHRVQSLLTPLCSYSSKAATDNGRDNAALQHLHTRQPPAGAQTLYTRTHTHTHPLKNMWAPLVTQDDFAQLWHGVALNPEHLLSRLTLFGPQGNVSPHLLLSVCKVKDNRVRSFLGCGADVRLHSREQRRRRRAGKQQEPLSKKGDGLISFEVFALR